MGNVSHHFCDGLGSLLKLKGRIMTLHMGIQQPSRVFIMVLVCLRITRAFAEML